MSIVAVYLDDIGNAAHEKKSAVVSMGSVNGVIIVANFLDSIAVLLELVHIVLIASIFITVLK